MDIPLVHSFVYNRAMKRIAVLTRDCGGVNAAIRAVVRTASATGLEVLGVRRAYEGLIDGDFVPLDRRSVSNIIGHGGTILKTSRSHRFHEAPFRAQAARNLRQAAVDGLVVIGGNGSLAAAHILATEHGVRVVGIPATIDNDVPGVAQSLGGDTALNVALDALDKIRDTATSMERIFVVEVMGRQSGWLAMNVALAGGCEEVLLPERELPLDVLFQEIRDGYALGKISWIIILAEGKGRAQDVAAAITEATGLETRIAVLGHIQRGGRPTAVDRIMASRLGHAAVEALRNGSTDGCVHIKNGRIEFLPFPEAARARSIETGPDYRLLRILS